MAQEGQPFKDHFSRQAEVYAKYRPTYPEELFRFLHGLTEGHTLAWDCGTGNGQSAVGLAAFYERVHATDPSREQLRNAIRHPGVTYHVERAEDPSLPDGSVDLATAAQAVHWFDFGKFHEQVRRVLKPNGIIAVWAYGIPRISAEVDGIIHDFHDNIVGEFWAAENRMIADRYTTIPFPFKEIEAPPFLIRSQVDPAQVLGLLGSWSATRKYMDKYGTDPVEPLRGKLQACWGAGLKEMAWDLILRVGRTGRP